MSIAPSPDELALAAVIAAPYTPRKARADLAEVEALFRTQGYDDDADRYQQAQAVLDDYYRS